MKYIALAMLLTLFSCSKSTDTEEPVTPDKPTNVYVASYSYSGGNCSIVMRWSGNAESYEYEYLEIHNAVWSNNYRQTTSKTCTITINADNEPYFKFRVRAVNDNLKSEWSYL